LTAHDVLKKYFGYDSFRDGQENLINDILAGKDVLGIMPTGAGKSMCFQVPAMMMSGMTLVVSPLISLMKDQVNALNQAGVPAAFINSSLSESQMTRALKNARDGVYKLIYVAPERLVTHEFETFVSLVDISMLVVDEAHCISQWGQDFRPSYTAIPNFVASLRTRPVLSAFTATATPNVREDIAARLALKAPTVLVSGFDRPNLYFEAYKPPDKLIALDSFLADKKTASGIVYCSTRKAVDEVHTELIELGYNASRYHAGLSDKERHDNQDDFLHDRVNIMVATNAFGMGIDKSNVSFVVHYNMPKDIEAYYQEAGRAGRDGEPATCLLLYGGRDYATQLWLIDNGENKVQLDYETELMLKERSLERLGKMAMYCETKDCLRAYILRYFGEKPSQACGNCANCNTIYEELDITIEAKKIISCVARMRGRYGANMIIDVLRGKANQRVRNFGLDRISTFGILDAPATRLSDIINYLIQDEYLHKTADKFPLVRLGARASEALADDAKLAMKAAQNNIIATKRPAKSIRPVDGELFDALKSLRMEIASKNKVPAFVVFPDSALVDMCMKMPSSIDEFLGVSGVGQVKAERFGKAFLDEIKKYNENKVDNTQSNMQFEPKEYDSDDVKASEEAVTVSAVADIINVRLMQSGLDKLTGKRINDWLVKQGFMEIVQIDGKNFKTATEKGKALGVRSLERHYRGEKTIMNFYDKEAQGYIAKHAREI